MKVFRCTCPDRPVLFFENIQCGQCRRLTGFCSRSMTLKPFVPAHDALTAEPATSVWADDEGRLYLQCNNWTTHAACNWMIPLQATGGDEMLPLATDQKRLCPGCRLNDIIPDLTVQENVTLWRKLEVAKRRCLYSLLGLALPVGDAAGRVAGPIPELKFRFLADRDSTAHFESPLAGEKPVLTGHQNGVITINLAEADDIARTRMRVDMDEPYRTLLGHFRHETGHYYWDVFRLADQQFQDEFRSLFGDETQSYADAVQRHYSQGPEPHWQRRFVSPYASMHPWEDWAETWAHYLHIIDTLQTRQQFGESPSGESEPGFSPAHTLADDRLPEPASAVTSPDGADSGAADDADFRTMISQWIDTSIMLNSLNRSMGLPDPYPFVLNREVKRKLRFIDATIRRWMAHSTPDTSGRYLPGID